MISEKEALKIKIELLSYGVAFPINLFENYEGEFYDNQFVYGQTSKDACPKYRFPQVIILRPGINCAILRRLESPYSLKFEKGEFALYKNNTFVTNIILPEKPKYFGTRLSDGTPIENVLAVAGEATPGFFFYPNCYYFDNGMQCRFCSMKGTRLTVGKHMTTFFSRKLIQECISVVENTEWRTVPIYSVTTGTCDSDEKYKVEIIKPLRIMSESMEKKTNIHLLTHPPKDMDLLYELKKAGVTTIAFNLEVNDRDMMRKICPGKYNSYGYDEWWSALRKARDIWGEWNVFCGLVWGLEDIESTMRGNHAIADEGISIASNIFHADPKSAMNNHAHLAVDGINTIAHDLYSLYKSHPQMKTIFEVSMRSTVDWEIKKGYLF